MVPTPPLRGMRRAASTAAHTYRKCARRYPRKRGLVTAGHTQLVKLELTLMRVTPPGPHRYTMLAVPPTSRHGWRQARTYSWSRRTGARSCSACERNRHARRGMCRRKPADHIHYYQQLEPAAAGPLWRGRWPVACSVVHQWLRPFCSRGVRGAGRCLYTRRRTRSARNVTGLSSAACGVLLAAPTTTRSDAHGGRSRRTVLALCCTAQVLPSLPASLWCTLRRAPEGADFAAGARWKVRRSVRALNRTAGLASPPASSSAK
jgi:hypothetical protein